MLDVVNTFNNITLVVPSRYIHIIFDTAYWIPDKQMVNLLFLLSGYLSHVLYNLAPVCPLGIVVTISAIPVVFHNIPNTNSNII